MASMCGQRIIRSIFALGMIAFSGAIVWGSPAQAAPPSEVGGMAWNDSNADGLRDPDEVALAGVQVQLVDVATNLVVAGPVTTDATGSYLFSSLALGTYQVEVRSPDSYWVSASTTESVVVPIGAGGAPSSNGISPLLSLDGTNSIMGFNVAVRPRPELSLRPFGPGVIDGGPDFNTSSTCSIPVAEPTPTGSPEWADATAPGQNPGDDCGSSNGIVRTQDSVLTIWSATSDNYEPGAPDLYAVIFEQVIHPQGGAVVDYSRIPVSCLAPPQGTGGAAPVSEVTYNDPAPGDVKLTCNLGSFPEGFQESITTAVHVSSESNNGSSFTTTQRVYGLDEGGQPNAVTDSSVEIGPVTVSAAPAYDLAKDTIGILNYGSEVRDMSFDDHLPSCDTDPQPCDVGPEPGRYGYFMVSLSTDSKAGIEAIAQPFSIEDDFFATTDTPGVGTPYAFEYEITECRWNPSGWGNSVYGRWVSDESSAWYGASVRDSGTCTPARSDEQDSTSNYSFVLDDIDMSGADYPSRRYGGADLSAGPYFVAMHRVRFFVPFRSIDLSDGVVDNRGHINLTNCMDNFDPDSVTGVSNFGPGTEPGYSRALMPDGSGTNNCAGPTTFELTTRGGFSKYNYGYIGTNGYPYQQPGNRSHSGAHTLEPGQTFPAVIWNQNRGTTDLADPRSCDVFDNTTLRLSTAESVGRDNWVPAGLPNGSYAYVLTHSRWNSNSPSDFIVEYASADLSADDPLRDGFDSVTSRHEGSWSVAAAFRCDDNATATLDGITYGLNAPNAGADLDGDGWTTDPTAFTNGIDSVNMVRSRVADPAMTLEAADRFPLVVPLELRDVFRTGPHAGTSIPAGTVAPNFGSARWGYYAPLQWTARRYQPSPETGHSDGDRVTLTRAQLRIQKHTLVPLTEIGNNGSTLAGSQIVWELIPTVTSQLSTPADIHDLTVVDVLPSSVSYNATCTAERADGTPPSLVEPNQPNPGETTLTWILGDWTPNTEVPRLVICTDSDPIAANGTALVNTVETTATGVAFDSATQRDTHTIVLEQAGSIQLSKSVDLTLDDQNDSQEFTLAWTNFAAAFIIQPPTVIDVFAYNGDGSGSLSERYPESDFRGSYVLLGAPETTFSDGSVPNTADGDPQAEIGTWTYSSDDPATIDYNPDLNSSTWCLEADFGTAGCPDSFAGATAIKFVSNYDLERDGNPRQGVVAKYAMQAGDPSTNPNPAKENQPGDSYTNRFALDSASLDADQYLRSNNVTVVVAAYSIGDLIFADVDGDGVYDPAIDTPAPDGVVVHLRRSSDGSLVASTTTNAGGRGAGRYLFPLLASGDYYVQLPASNFVSGPLPPGPLSSGQLSGWLPTAIPFGAQERDDNNEDVDQHGYTTGAVEVDGLRTGSLTLSAEPPLPGGVPVGDEPLGDNTAGLADSTNDDFSNLTLDIGLVAPPDISILKEVCNQVPITNCDLGTDSHWVESSEIGYGQTAQFRLTVQNTGGQTLSNVVITDPTVPACGRTVVDLSGLDSMNPGDRVVYGCEVEGVLGAFTNTATARATATVGEDPTDSDTASVTVASARPEISIEKATNTVDADAAPGIYADVSDPITWTYVVTNAGNMPLQSVRVVDDMGTPADTADDVVMSRSSMAYVSGDTNSDSQLDLDEQWTFELHGFATQGQYTNTAQVVGTPIVAGLPEVSDSDKSNYFGLVPPSITIEKATNADDPWNPTVIEDADDVFKAIVGATSDVTWTYLVSTVSDSDPVLHDVQVTDDNGTTTLADDIVAAYVAGDDGDGLLEAGEVWLFSASGSAIAGDYANTATVTASGPDTTSIDGSRIPGTTVSDSDLSQYSGASPDIAIVKRVNGDDANVAPGIPVQIGSTVVFTYDVTNTGDTLLIDIVVSDDQAVVVTCPTTVLGAGATMRCTGSSSAVAGNYTNIGEATGTPAYATPFGSLQVITNGDGSALAKPTATDPANYHGLDAALQITKYVDGHDANEQPGIAVNPGDEVTFSYVVDNTGDLAIANIDVSDDQGVVVDCPASELTPGASMTCTGSAIAIAGRYTNIGTVSGDLGVLDGDGTTATVQDSDPANYVGATPSIEITKYVEGHDANNAPGITLPSGVELTWTYVVTNNGNTWLVDLVVDDDQGVVVTCPNTELEPAASMTCHGSGIVEPGPYTNIGSVTGTAAMPSPVGALVTLGDSSGDPWPQVHDDDPANNFGYETGIELTKYVFGHDAPEGDPLYIVANEEAVFTYEVTNTGNTWLDSMTVSDDRGVVVECPEDFLAPGSSMTCRGEGMVGPGPYRNVATVLAEPTLLSVFGRIPITNPSTQQPVNPVTATDDANLYGELTDIHVTKVSCYQDTCGDNLALPENAVLTWKIAVTNAGNVVLDDVNVVDSKVPACDRLIDSMAVGETVHIECTAPVSVARVNTATATGTPRTQVQTQDSDYATRRALQVHSDVTSEATAQVRVLTSTSSTGLAHTGNESAGLVAGGLGFIALGCSLVASTRRRRSGVSS